MGIWFGVCYFFGEVLSPGGSGGKESACNVEDQCSVLGWGRYPGGGHGNPLQHSCLENPMDQGAWRATVLGSQRVRHNRATKNTQPLLHQYLFLSILSFFYYCILFTYVNTLKNFPNFLGVLFWFSLHIFFSFHFRSVY